MSTSTGARLSLVIDLDRCDGCGACAVACALENNTAVPPATSGVRKGLTPLRVETVRHAGDAAFVPIMCQHCQTHTPCVSVCPQTAVDVDPQTGVVSQIVDRCLGCRYCMAACAYHARSFNWYRPEWTDTLATSLAPDVPVRMRGVVEKCNLCHGRLQRAQDEAAARGVRDAVPEGFRCACEEVCPRGAIHHVDFADPDDPMVAEAAGPRAFRLLEHFGTGPSVAYLSSREWVRRIDRLETFLEERGVGHV